MRQSNQGRRALPSAARRRRLTAKCAGSLHFRGEHCGQDSRALHQRPSPSLARTSARPARCWAHASQALQALRPAAVPSSTAACVARHLSQLRRTLRVRTLSDVAAPGFRQCKPAQDETDEGRRTAYGEHGKLGCRQELRVSERQLCDEECHREADVGNDAKHAQVANNKPAGGVPMPRRRVSQLAASTPIGLPMIRRMLTAASTRHELSSVIRPTLARPKSRCLSTST